MIELSFPLSGTPLPYDHGYLLYRAVAASCRGWAKPAQIDLAIVPIQGSPHGGFLHLTSLPTRVSAERRDTEKLLAADRPSPRHRRGNAPAGAATEFRLRPVPGLASPFVVAEHHRHSDAVLELAEAEFRALDIRRSRPCA